MNARLVMDQITEAGIPAQVVMTVIPDQADHRTAVYDMEEIQVEVIRRRR